MTIAKRDVFVIVAARNEGKVLARTIEPLVELGYSVVVVDDGSCDDTSTVARGLGVHSLRHLVNLGQGAALQTGMTYALSKGAAVCVHFDADGQHRVDDLPAMLEPIARGEADVALGSRFLRATDAQAVPARKRAVLRVGVLVNAVMTGLWLSDAHNGFRALSRSAAEKVELCHNGFSHASEILRQIRKHRLRHVEVPTTVLYSSYSMAKGQSMWNAFNIVFDLATGMIRR